MRDGDKQKTTFKTDTMNFWLCPLNAPAMFFEDLWKFVLILFDDILIYNSDMNINVL